MHELGITQSLLQLALHHAEQAGAVRVRELTLVIGELSSIIDDSLQFYWDMLSKDTIAHGAHLNFKRVAASLHCDECGHDFPLDRREYVCPQCGGTKIRVAGGEEFFLESIAVDLATETETTRPRSRPEA
jgi:hydrogenase nickel incorporation protein HypA/HybF